MMMMTTFLSVTTTHWFYLLAITCVCHGLSSPPSNTIQFWDNVLNSVSRTKLHQAASSAGLSHKLLDRSLPSNSLLESALGQILVQLKVDSRYVEYWCRQKWRHIEAHADIDEFRAKRNQTDLQRPVHGHVLYLCAGTQVHGHTCLFSNCRTGGDLSQTQTFLTTVPAVEGRLLRFPGSWLHAVPRPTDIWLLPFVQGTPDFTFDTYGRSVVLFNTWNDQAPLEVPTVQHDNEPCHRDGQQLVTGRTRWRKQDIPSLLST
jgi:hypothetical protein